MFDPVRCSTRLMVVLTALLIAVAAEASTSPKAQFISHAEADCTRASTAIQSLPPFPFKNFDALHPDKSVLPKVGQFFSGPGNEVPIARRLVRQLTALGTPPVGRAAWVAMLGTFREFVTVIRAEATAASHGDVRAWVAAVQENRLLPDRLTSAANVFGAKRCAIFK
jgi:hypothetical protein